jgi:ribonuclease T1
MRSARVLSWLLLATLLSSCGTASIPGVPEELPTLRPPELTPAVLAIDPESGLPVVLLSELPMEATDTVRLIDGNGPFPYDQDGAVFQNREGILPSRPEGYYHEYTVETPDSSDRGARRIVAGGPGTSDLFYTGDHYDSFQWIRQ